MTDLQLTLACVVAGVALASIFYAAQEVRLQRRRKAERVESAFLELRGDASNFGAWLNQIAVMRVRQRIRKRRLRRWLSFREPEAMPERVSSVGQPAERLALSRAYHILGQLNADDRIVFGLRFIDRQSIPEIAELCKISCATVKRRLTHADARFRLLAGKDMILRDWLVGEVEL